MVSIRQTSLYSNVIKEFNYSFGNVFIFDGFVVSEINQGVVFTWDNHAKLIVEDISGFLGTYGNDIIYISNRVYSYSVIPSDWLKFFKNNFNLKSYLVVLDKVTGKLNCSIENLFFKDKIQRFSNIYTAVNYVRNGLLEIA